MTEAERLERDLIRQCATLDQAIDTTYALRMQADKVGAGTGHLTDELRSWIETRYHKDSGALTESDMIDAEMLATAHGYYDTTTPIWHSIKQQ